MLNSEQKLYLLALRETPGVGPVIAKNLISYCGGPEKVFGKPKGFLKQIPEIGEKVASALQNTPDLSVYKKEIGFCDEHGIQIVSYLDADYPEYLKTIHNAPLVLFQKGNLDLNARPAVAVIGTRSPSDYGKKQTEIFTQYLAEKGINVVSGLAYGIDILAHETALAVGGVTTAVLGHGFGTLYPAQHKAISENIIQNGRLITEYLFETKPDPKNFPFRNRIIAGMSRAVIVVEGAAKGGAIMTARMAFDQNREVYAIPGNLGRNTSEGCNILIRDSIAKLVTQPAEVIEDLGLDALLNPTQSVSTAHLFKPIETPLSAEEQIVLNIFVDKGEYHLDELATKTGISVSSLLSTLMVLEFRGLIAQGPGRKFSRL